MAFRSSQDARVFIAHLAAAAYARTADVTSTTDMAECTTLADRSRQYVPDRDTGMFSIAGPLDSDGAANGQFDTLADLKASPTAPTPVTYLPLGTDGAAWLLNGYETEFNTSAGQSGTVDYTAAVQTTGQTDFNGVLLVNSATITADTDAGTVDNGAATSNGAAFHLHVTAFSGFSSDVIIVEGSTTGAFAGEETTIATFATVTGVTSERLTVTGTVPRYLRVSDNVTGTGSITRTVAVSRR